MIFYINEYKWNIELVDSDVMLMNNNGLFFGLSDYENQNISIRKGLSERSMRTTVIHELCHCFLFSYGMNTNTYDEEQVCNFIGAYADKIVKLTDEFMKGVKTDAHS